MRKSSTSRWEQTTLRTLESMLRRLGSATARFVLVTVMGAGVSADETTSDPTARNEEDT